MKNKINFVLLLLLIISFPTFSQGPGEPYFPETANGAEGALPGGWFGTHHYLKWKNPIGTNYNEVYLSDDSLLVALLDTSTRILNGYPNIAYNEVMPTYPSYEHFKKYYWRIVEYGLGGFTVGPVWYYRTRVWPGEIFEEHFDSLDNWIVVGPSGFNNWSGFGELQFNGSPAFVGQSFIRFNRILPGGYGTFISFKHTIFAFNTVTVGLAYTTDNGSNWISFWEKTTSGYVAPEVISFTSHSIDEIFHLGFYFSGNSSNILYWNVDDLIFGHPIETYDPPGFLQVSEDSINLKVTLNWTSGYSIGPLNYKIKRKIGLPTDTTSYSTIGYACNALLSYEDYEIQPNIIYTYRVHTVLPCPNSFMTSIGGNEATAYVPNIVPVELQSFTAELIGRDVSLNWSTATETNNQGFEIERLQNSKIEKLQEWDVIGFVPGFGTTTQVHHYDFNDESLESGNYQYRLKQIDFDGSFEYSNIIEVTVAAPTKFSLQQNYPNPFNPTTKIKYQIPLSPPLLKGEIEAGGFVTLKIYDVLGNEIAILVDEYKPAGRYEVEFDGTELPSGVYFYQLKAGEYVSTKKMVLLR
jgi:Secretion system C-terminal sorting domain